MKRHPCVRRGQERGLIRLVLSSGKVGGSGSGGGGGGRRLWKPAVKPEGGGVPQTTLPGKIKCLLRTMEH